MEQEQKSLSREGSFEAGEKKFQCRRFLWTGAETLKWSIGPNETKAILYNGQCTCDFKRLFFEQVQKDVWEAFYLKVHKHEIFVGSNFLLFDMFRN